MTRGIFATFLALLFACPARAEFPETVTIGEKIIECRTVEEIRNLGFECEDIPWKDNAARVLIEAMNAYRHDAWSAEFYRDLGRAQKNFDFRDIDKRVEDHLKDNERAFELLRQADLMPRYCLPMHKSAWIMETLLPELYKYQAMARSLNYRAAFEFWQGKHTDAIDDGILTMRLGRRVSTEPQLISGVLGIAVQSITTKTLCGMASSGKMSDAELKHLDARLAKDVQLPSWEHALRSERAWVFGTVSDLERGGYDLYRKLITVMGDAQAAQAVDKDSWGAAFRPDVTRKNLSDYYDFCDTNAKRPVHEAMLPANSATAFVNDHRGDWDKVTPLFVVGVDKARMTYVRAQVTFDALCVRVALERFKLAHKAYPKNLAELVPAYLDKLPTDPFSGKPYGCRVEDDGNFLLWSVGDDLKDDGGKGDASSPWVGPDYVFTSRRDEAK